MSLMERVDIADLPTDMKRMLKVQVKELIHTIEDIEFEQKQSTVPEFRSRVISVGFIHRRVDVA